MSTGPYTRHDGGLLGDVSAPRTVVRTETAFSGAVWDVTRETFTMTPSVEPLVREFIRHPGAVAVVALDGQDRVRLIRQYRHPVGEELWEIPAGLLDLPGEPPLDAARRELAEEVDLQAGQWDVLTDFYTTPGSSSEMIRVFLATGLAEVPDSERHVRTGEEAGMPAAWVPVTEAVDAVLAGRVRNPTLVVGLLALAAHRSRPDATLRPVGEPWHRRPERT